MARLAGADRMVHPTVRVVIGVALVLLLAVGLALARRNTVLDQLTAYSLALCATLLVSPLAWSHYYMVELPAVLCVPVWLSWRGMPRLARVVAAIAPILLWSHYLAMPYTGELGLLGLGTAAWFLLACVCILAIEVSAARAPIMLDATSDAGNLRMHRPSDKYRGRRRGSRPAASLDAFATRV